MNPAPDDEKRLDDTNQSVVTPEDTVTPRPEETYSEPEIIEPIAPAGQPATSTITPAAAPHNPAIANQPAANPGKGLAITSLVLAFVPLTQLIGLILSVVALVKSLPKTSAQIMAIIGIVLNVVNSIGWGILFAIIIVAYQGVQQRAQTAASEAAARTLETQVTTYVTKHQKLPATASDLGNSVRLTTLDGKPADAQSVEYAICDYGQAARFGYWDYQAESVKYTFIKSDGSNETTTNCTVVTP